MPIPKPSNTEGRIKRILEIIGDDFVVNIRPWTHTCHVSVKWRGLSVERVVRGLHDPQTGFFISMEKRDGLIASMKSELAEMIERLLFNVCAGIFQPNGFEPSDLFESDWLEGWLRERGWIHD